MVEGEASLRRKMKADPLTYPRWTFGVKANGVLIQKAFPRKGTYTGKGQGEETRVIITETFPCISTIAYYRAQMKQ